MKKHIVLVLGLLTSIGLSAQIDSSAGPLEVAVLSSIPLGQDEVLQPHLGVITMASVTIGRHEDFDLSFGLGVGVTGSTIQLLDIDSTSWWQDVDERLFYLRSDLFIAFPLDQRGRFGLELGPGVEYVFHKRLDGIQTTLYELNGKDSSFSKEARESADPSFGFRATLGLRLIYHGTVHGTSLDIGPYFDYASFLGSRFQQEVSSRKFGIYIGLRL